MPYPIFLSILRRASISARRRLLLAVENREKESIIRTLEHRERIARENYMQPREAYLRYWGYDD